MTDIAVLDWVAEFLNRRTDVENALRAPLKAQAKGLPMPDGFPLTAEAMNALADRLSVPAEFMPNHQEGS